MEGDLRSFRIAIAEDRYVNPPAGGLDGLAVLGAAGWGVIQLPEAGYPDGLKASMLTDVAEQSEEFWRRGYDVVLVGEDSGLAEALAVVGMPWPDQVVPADEDELAAFLRARPAPKAAQLLPATLTTRWAEENPRSELASERASRVLAGGVTHDVRLAEPFPIAVSRALGSRKWDLDGHELVCYVMGHGALLLGHGHPEVVAAVREQATRSLHPGASHELETEWAETVISMVPSAERVRFTSSGTEASLLALRLARAATGRPKIVKLAGHFHGWHDQVAVGSEPPFDGPDTAGLPAGIGSSVVVVPACADAVAGALAGRDVAALILEPSGAAWGTVPFEDGFLGAVRRLTDASGTVLVFDEVVSGFRWAPGGVQAVSGVIPDLTVLGKILAGGLPGGAVGGRTELMDHFGAICDPRRVFHPGTHNAHPLSAAAGVTTLGLLRSGEGQRQAAATAEVLRRELTSVFPRHGVAGRAYGESSTFHLLFGTEQSPDELGAARLKAPPPRHLASALNCGMLLSGIQLFHGSGFVSTEHTSRDIEQTVEAFNVTLPRLQSEGLV